MPALKKTIENSSAWMFWVLVLWTAFEYLRPQSWLIKALVPFKIPAILTLILIFIFIANKKNYIKEEKGYILFFLFVFISASTVIFAPNTRAVFNESSNLFWAGVGFILPAAYILNNSEKLIKYFRIWLVIQLTLALIVIYRGGTGTGSYLTDENDVALVLNMALPFAVYMMYFPDNNFRAKVKYAFISIVIIVAIGVTASRGGVVGLAAVTLSMLAISRAKVKNTMLLVLVAVIAGTYLLNNLPKSYVKDMENMSNPQDSTRKERLYSWSIGWEMYKRNPLLGVGAGNYPWTNHLYAHYSPMWTPDDRLLGGRVAHSLYITLISELGTIGAIVFILILRIFYKNYKSTHKILYECKESITAKKLLLLNKAIAISLIGYLVSGIFITVLYYPVMWYLYGMMLINYRITRLEFDKPDKDTINSKLSDEYKD